MSKVKTQTLAPAKESSPPVAELNPPTPRKAAGRAPLARQQASSNGNGAPHPSQAAGIVTVSSLAHGLASRAHASSAMQRSVGNARLSRILDSAPKRGGATQSALTHPNGNNGDLQMLPVSRLDEQEAAHEQIMRMPWPEQSAREQQEHGNEEHKQLLEIQNKSLEVSNPNDADEKEADEIARKVVDGQSAAIHETGETGNINGAGYAKTVPEFQSKLEGSKGGGQSLDDSTRSEMESKMDADFSGVKVHTGSEAHAMNESINAKAFTHGQDVFFKKGELNTNSKQGKELLAHELAHTQQQKNGLRRKIQRQQTERKDTNYVGGFERSIDVSKKFHDLFLGNLNIEDNPYVTITATLTTKVKFLDLTKEKREQLSLEFGSTEVVGELDKHLYKITASGFKAGYDSFNAPEDPEIKFALNGKLEGLNTTLKGIKPTLDLLKLTITAAYQINQGNIDSQPGFIKSLLKKHPSLYDEIVAGKVSIEGAFNVSISIRLKALAKYLKDMGAKVSKEVDKQEHTEKEKKYKDEAKDAKSKKNEALKEKNRLNNDLQQKENELKRLQKDKNLTPAEAEERIKSLEKEIADKQKEANKFNDAWQKEKEAMEKAQQSANQEKKAAQKVGRELKDLDKEMRRFEEKAGRFKKVTRKLEQKIEKQLLKLDKMGRRLAEKSAKWVEEKAVRWIGKKLAKKAAELVARVILRAIPIIGELLLIWDALELLWDLGSALWDWFTGKEGEGEGEGDGEETEKGESAEGAQGRDSAGEGDTETVDSGTVTKNVDGDKVPGGVDKGDLGSGTTPSTKDTTTQVTDIKDTTTTTTFDKESPSGPRTDTTTVTDKPTLTSKVGVVRTYEEPSPNATTLKLRTLMALELTDEQLIPGKVYIFKLAIYFTDENKNERIVESNVGENFRYIETENGIHKFQVATPFIIEINERRIYFKQDFKLSLSSKK